MNSLKTLGLSDWRAQVFVLASLALIALSAGAWTLGTGITAVARTSAILADGELTMARVVEVTQSVPNPVGSPTEILVTTRVEFDTAEGETVSAVLPLAGAQPDYGLGDEVELVYDRQSATSVVLADEGLIASQSAGIWIGGLVIVVGLLPVVAAVRVVRKSRIMGE